MVGGEYEVIPNLAVGLKYVNRDLKNIMEDALSADGDYFIGNPGQGLMTGTYDIGYAFGYNETLHHLAVPTRKFEGYELTVTKRPTRRTSSSWRRCCTRARRAPTTACSRRRPASSTRT